MKYKDENGNWQELYLEALGDDLPIGTQVEYVGQDADIPNNWEKISENLSTGVKIIRKTSQTTPTNAVIYNEYTDSTTDGYSTDYVNSIVDNFDDTTGNLNNLTTTDKTSLVNAINEINSDTGWQDITLSNDFQLYSQNDICQYRKIGKTVQIKGAVTPKVQIAANAEVTMFTLPEGCRPLRAVSTICQGSGLNRWHMFIGSSGDVTVSRYGTTSATAIPTSAWLVFSATFLVD